MTDPSATPEPAETGTGAVAPEPIPEPAPQADGHPDPTPAETQADEASAAPPGEESPGVGPVEAHAEPHAEGHGHAHAEAHHEGEAKPKRESEIRRSRRHSAVARAYRLGLPVEGHVEAVIKGGYEIRVGEARGFCPHSQMELHRVGNPEDHVGKGYPFKIIQMRRGGEDLVLSRRALLEEEKGEEAKAVRATLIEGTVMLGRVAGLADFGAFVDLGAGVMGLVHVSELAHGRVPKPADVVTPGDWVRVKILKLDEVNNRISLSIRQAEEDPWATAASHFKEGHVYPGTVLRVTDFGAFIELQRGVEALAPAREFPPVEGGWEAAAPIGESRDWVVLSIEPERRRLSVAPAPEPGQLPADAPITSGSTVQGKVQKVERFGVFVWLAPGKVGLLPNALTGVPRGTPVSTRFRTGQEIEVEVLEVADEGRRIRLGVPGVIAEEPPPRRDRDRERGRDRDRDRGRRTEEMPTQVSSSGGSFGTSLGDVLRAAMEKKGT